MLKTAPHAPAGERRKTWCWYSHDLASQWQPRNYYANPHDKVLLGTLLCLYSLQRCPIKKKLGQGRGRVGFELYCSVDQELEDSGSSVGSAFLVVNSGANCSGSE